MKSVFISAVLVISLGIAACAQSGQQTFTGVVSDNMCGKQHMAKDKSAAQCTRECVKGGSDYALVVGDKVYKIDNPDAVKGHYGHKVTVDGNVSGDSIHVDSVKM